MKRRDAALNEQISAKRILAGVPLQMRALLEYFNILNRNNPAAVENLATETSAPRPPFGADLQVLPGREGQVGIRFDF